jgi:hypothetical protein
MAERKQPRPAKTYRAARRNKVIRNDKSVWRGVTQHGTRKVARRSRVA